MTEFKPPPSRPQRRTLPTGVYRRPHGALYRAILSRDGKQVYLGDFKTVEEAHAVYVACKRGAAIAKKARRR